MQLEINPDNIDRYLEDFANKSIVLQKKMEMRAPLINALNAVPFVIETAAAAWGALMAKEQELLAFEAAALGNAITELTSIKDRMSSGLVVPSGSLGDIRGR